MRWFGALLAALFMAVGVAAGQAAAQVAAPAASQGILIVDRERVIRESAPGRALAGQVQERRLALQQASAEMDQAMQAEETEIDQIRNRLTPQQFEDRLRDFDQRVRQVRRESQEALQNLQEQVGAARRQLDQALNIVLRDILEARGASVLLNAQTVIMAREEIDITAEAIERFSAEGLSIDLSPGDTAQDGG